MLCQPISSGGNWKLFVTLIKWTVKISWQIRWALVWWTKFRRSSPPFSHFCFPQFPQCFPRWKRGYPVELESFLLFSTFLPTAFPKNMLSKHNRFTAFFCGFAPFFATDCFYFSPYTQDVQNTVEQNGCFSLHNSSVFPRIFSLSTFFFPRHV